MHIESGAALFAAGILLCFAASAMGRRAMPRAYSAAMLDGATKSSAEPRLDCGARVREILFESSWVVVALALILAGVGVWIAGQTMGGMMGLVLETAALVLAAAALLVLFLRWVVNWALNFVSDAYGRANPEAYAVTVRYEWTFDTSVLGLLRYFCACGFCRAAPSLRIIGERASMASPRPLTRIATWWGGKRLPLRTAPDVAEERQGVDPTGDVYAQHPELAISAFITELTVYVPRDWLPADAGELLYVDLEMPDRSSSTVLLLHSVTVKRRFGSAEVQTWHFPSFSKLGVNTFQLRVFEGTASLPQNDAPAVRQARREALERNRALWKWRAYTPAGGFTNPAWAGQPPGALPSALNVGDDQPLLGFSIDAQDEMPVDEYFGATKAIDFYTAAVESQLAVARVGRLDEPWASEEEVSRSWQTTRLAAPVLWTSSDPVAAWKQDAEFAAQMLQGSWPDSWRVADALPRRLAQHLPTSTPLPPEAGGGTLGLALRQRRILVTDMSALASYTQYAQANATLIPCYVVCAAKPDGGAGSPGTPAVVPVAILLLFEDRSDQLYTTADAPNHWLLAKTAARSAMANIHQALVHALRCHLCTEPYAVALRRHLSAKHPLHKLLLPHIRYTVLINFLARLALISPGGIFDKTSSIGGEKQGFLKLMADEYEQGWTPLSEHLPDKLRARGLMPDQGALPTGSYPYRDSALPIWDALESYVRSIVESYYASDADVVADEELQAFARDLATEGFPSGRFDPSLLRARASLIDVITTVCWVASGRHAAVNFLQYQQYAYGPNFPLWMIKAPPSTRQDTVTTVEEALSYMCTRGGSINQAATVWILSEYGSPFLMLSTPGGGPRFQELFVEGPGLEAVRELARRLSAEELEANERAGGTARGSGLEYRVLTPSLVPQSIAI